MSEKTNEAAAIRLQWFGANQITLANGETVDCQVITEKDSLGQDEEVACIYGSEDNDVNAARAELIARAVNAFDALRWAVVASGVSTRPCAFENNCQASGRDLEAMCPACLAKAALALAESEAAR